MEDDYRGWPHLMCSGFDADKRALMSYDVIYGFLKTLPEKIGMQKMGLPIVYKVNQEAHVPVSKPKRDLLRQFRAIAVRRLVAGALPGDYPLGYVL